MVTGAAGGLGVCFARKLAERGYDLMLVDCRQEPLAQLAAELARKHGVAARAWPADLTDAEAVKSVAAELAETPSVELLVNNAGFGLAKYFVDDDVERHVDMIGVHVLAAVRLDARGLARHDQAQSRGHRQPGVAVSVAAVRGERLLLFHQGLPGRLFARAARRASRHGHSRSSLVSGLCAHGFSCPGRHERFRRPKDASLAVDDARRRGGMLAAEPFAESG